MSANVATYVYFLGCLEHKRFLLGLIQVSDVNTLVVPVSSLYSDVSVNILTSYEKNLFLSDKLFMNRSDTDTSIIDYCLSNYSTPNEDLPYFTLVSVSPPCVSPSHGGFMVTATVYSR